MKDKATDTSDRDRKRGKDSLTAKRKEARRNKAVARGAYAGRKVERARGLI